MSNQREVFNSDDLPKPIESVVGRKGRRDLFCYESQLLFAGDLTDHPKGKRIVHPTLGEYVVTTLRYNDGRGAVWDCAKAWEVGPAPRSRKRF